jgi:hypothetical protein
MEAISPYETSVIKRTTWHHRIVDDRILHCYHRSDVKYDFQLSGLQRTHIPIVVQGTKEVHCSCSLCIPGKVLLRRMLSSGIIRRVDLGFLQEPHGATYQKLAFFKITAVKTSNRTKSCYLKFELFLNINI